MKRKSILILLIALILTLSCFTTVVQATGVSDIIQGADDFIASGSQHTPLTSDMKSLTNSVYNILLIIGIVLAVIIGAVLGIQFIVGSVEQKSKIKEMLIPYIIGCVVIFGAFGIWKLAVTIGAKTVTPGTPHDYSSTITDDSSNGKKGAGNGDSNGSANVTKQGSKMNSEEQTLMDRYKTSGIQAKISKSMGRGATDLKGAIAKLTDEERALYNECLNQNLINEKGVPSSGHR